MAALRILGSCGPGPVAGGRFDDRTTAGRWLAAALEEHRAGGALVLGVARGGVEVADALAQALELDLDVLAVRRLVAPEPPHATVGAITEGDIVYWNEDLVATLGIAGEQRLREVRRVSPELAAQQRNYRTLLPRARVRCGRVILVDDAVMTGTTIRAAIEAVVEAAPASLLVAVPGGPRRTLEELSTLARVDDVVVLTAPESLRGLEDLYRSFAPVSEHWVCYVLRAAYHRRYPDGAARASPRSARRSGASNARRSRGAATSRPRREAMKVEKLMTANVRACEADETLGAAAKIMWEADCGIVPVVDKSGHVIGVVTDRDICIACWSRDARPGSVRIGDTMTTAVKTCSPNDTVAAAEKIMEKHQIRRLPVTDAQGKLVGIISLNDITREAEREREQGVKRADVRSEEVIEAMAAICRPRAGGALEAAGQAQQAS